MDRFLIKRPRLTEESSGPSEPVIAARLTEEPSAPSETIIAVSNADTTSNIGVSSAPTSTSVNIEPKHTYKHTYKSYKQQYKKEWEKEFDFVIEKDGKAFCKYCIVYIVGGKTHLSRHEQSDGHKRKKLAVQTTPTLSSFVKNDEKLIFDRKVKSLEIKLVSFFVEHNVPLKAMDHFIPMLKSGAPDSPIIKSLQCSRTKATNIIINVLEKEHFSNIVTDLRKNRFSLIVDETTDVSTCKSLALVVRYAKHDCLVKDYFFSLLEVKSSTAEDLFVAIKTVLDVNNIPYKNLIGFASDSAAVMMGGLNGLQAKLKQLNKNLFVLGCTSHSMHLCASKACEKLPRTVEEFVRDVTNYFSNSSKRIIELQKYQDETETAQHRLLKLSSTRWLSLQNVIDRILEQWDPLKIFFSKEKEGTGVLLKASRISDAMCNPVFQIYLLFLSYVLKIINDLNVEFQSESPKIYLLHTRVESTLMLILKSYIKPAALERSNAMDININNPDNYLPIENIYIGPRAQVKISTSNVVPTELNKFKLNVLEFYIQLTREIRNRFKLSDDIIKFLSAFEPRKAISGEVDTICHISIYFPNIVEDIDIDQLDMEWRRLPGTVKQLNFKSENIENLWQELPHVKNSANEPMFLNLVKVFNCICSLPHSSATAERIFSQLSIIKTNHRNKLHIQTCSALLSSKEYIALLGGCVQMIVPPSLLSRKWKVISDKVNAAGQAEEDVMDDMLKVLD